MEKNVSPKCAGRIEEVSALQHWDIFRACGMSAPSPGLDIGSLSHTVPPDLSVATASFQKQLVAVGPLGNTKFGPSGCLHLQTFISICELQSCWLGSVDVGMKNPLDKARSYLSHSGRSVCLDL